MIFGLILILQNGKGKKNERHNRHFLVAGLIYMIYNNIQSRSMFRVRGRKTVSYSEELDVERFPLLRCQQEMIEE